MRGLAHKVAVGATTTAAICAALASLIVVGKATSGVVTEFWERFDAIRAHSDSVVTEVEATVDVCRGLRDGVLEYPRIVKRDVDSDFLVAKLRCTGAYVEALPDPNGLSNALDTTNRGVYGDPEPLPGKTPMADLVERLHMRLHTFVGSDRTRMLDVLSALDAARIGYSSIASKMSALAREVATLVSKTDVETGRDASLVIIAEIEEMRASDSEESLAITSAINLVEEQKGVPAMISADVSEADAMAARYRTVEIPLFRGSLEVIEVVLTSGNPAYPSPKHKHTHTHSHTRTRIGTGLPPMSWRRWWRVTLRRCNWHPVHPTRS